MKEKMERMEAAVRTLLLGVGEDPSREGLAETPKRVAKALLEVSRGYYQVHKSALGEALFHEPNVREGGQGIVLVRDIEFASTSEDTLLPFHGRCHIAYVPADGTVIGLSKLARITKLMAKRLVTQQRLGLELNLALQQHMACLGVAVVIVATHLVLAGPAPPAEQTTISVSGCFSGEHAPHLQMLMDMLHIPDLPASSIQLARCPENLDIPASKLPTQPSRSTFSSYGDSVAVDSSDKGCELSDKDELLDGEEHLSPMSTEDGERLGVFMEWDGEIAATAMRNKGQPHQVLQQHVGSHVTVDASQGLQGGASKSRCSVAEMEAAVQGLLAEMGECPSRTGLQGSARRYVATLLASTSGYARRMPQRAGSRDQSHTNSSPCSSWASTPHHHHQQRTHSSCSCCSDQSQRSLGGLDVVAAEDELVVPSSSPRPAFGTRTQPSNLPAHATGSSQGEACVDTGATSGQDMHLCCVVIPFNSQCEHHMLPFYGSASVVFLARTPGSNQASSTAAECLDEGRNAETHGGGVASIRGSAQTNEVDVGCSVGQRMSSAGVRRTHRQASVRERQAIEGIVSAYTQRLQVQERITHQVADAVAAELDATAVVVVVDAAHMCMVARGVENHAGRTTTMACRGLARFDAGLCRQALQTVNSKQRGHSRHRR